MPRAAHLLVCNSLDISVISKGALPDDFHEVVEYSILASKRNPFHPMEIAFQQFGAEFLADTGHLHPEWKLIREYPLSPKGSKDCWCWNHT
jgi:P-type Ca2+ transporter type 2C